MNMRLDPVSARSRPTLVRSIADTQPFLRAFISSAVILLLAKLAERLFFGDNYFASLGLHPFWIIVVIAAVQDGLFVGVAIAAMAALLMDWPPRPIGMDITAHYISVAVLPLQWLTAALVIGLFREAEISREKRLTAENAELHYLNETLSEEVRHIDVDLRDLRLQTVTRQSPATMSNVVIDRLIEVLSAHPDNMARGLREAAEMFGPHPASLFLLRNNRLMGIVDEDGDTLSDLNLAPEAAGLLLEELQAEGSSVIMSSDRFTGARVAKYLIIAGVYAQTSRKLAGAVVLQADSLAEASSMAKVAELLAALVHSALRQQGAAKAKEKAKKSVVAKRYRLPAKKQGAQKFDA